uniref:Uncharacterized protein n=1 Tax=Arundo donax TaxID=35708 RepID=A0A0A9C836_ARUDO
MPKYKYTMQEDYHWLKIRSSFLQVLEISNDVIITVVSYNFTFYMY